MNNDKAKIRKQSFFQISNVHEIWIVEIWVAISNRSRGSQVFLLPAAMLSVAVQWGNAAAVMGTMWAPFPALISIPDCLPSLGGTEFFPFNYLTVLGEFLCYYYHLSTRRKTVHENKAKYRHKMGWVGVKIRKALCIQAVKVHVLCSGLQGTCFKIIHDSSRHRSNVWGQLSSTSALF